MDARRVQHQRQLPLLGAHPTGGAPNLSGSLGDQLTNQIGGQTRGRDLPEWPAHQPLRAWQREASRALDDHPGNSFLASATPAAGKTTFGLHVAHQMLRSGRVSRVVVAGPTTHICRQWSQDAARYGIDLEPNRPNSDGAEPSECHGVAVTYQTIAAAAGMHARSTGRRTLLIADEPHHMGDQAVWGMRARKAFGNATFRLLLSGTPFRSDNEAIPWVAYDANGVSCADYLYGYPQALVDRVCRPITFLPYDGVMEWASDGRLRSADFDLVLPATESARRLRTALDASGVWMGEILTDADQKLSEVRADGHPDAGGLIVASDQEHARGIAARLARLTSQEPEIVMSDEPDASARIGAFADSRQRWLVSVLMVSEGVDIPRLRVGVYATAARTELFFRQVVGRFIRSTPTPARQMSYLLLPADSRLKHLAFEIEKERRHALDLSPSLGEEPIGIEEPAERGDPVNRFESLSSRDAELDEAIQAETTMQLFATDDPPKPRLPVSAVLGAGSSAYRMEMEMEMDHVPVEESAFAARERLRADRKKLVTDVSRRTDESHREVHARINRETGVQKVSSATREQLEKGNALLARELR